MADNVQVTPGTGNSIAADEVTDATLGVAKVQYVKIMDGTLDGTAKMKILAPSTAPVATDPAVVFSLSPNSPGLVNLGQAVKVASVPVTMASDQGSLGALSSSYPSGATAIAATSGNVAASTATATLAGAAAKTTYISGFSVVGSGATVGVVVLVTVTNLIGSVTFSYPLAAIAGALLMNTPLIVTFPNPIPASSTNTSIAVSCPSLGTGNTNNVVNAFGYQL